MDKEQNQRLAIEIIPAHAIKRLHPALTPTALALSGTIRHVAPHRINREHRRVLGDIAPVLMIVTRDVDGYQLISPVDWLPFVRVEQYARYIVVVVGPMDSEEAVQTACQYWLLHRYHHLHHGRSREEAAMAYLQAIEICTGAYPPNFAVAEALRISVGSVKRAKRRLRAGDL